LRDKDKEYQRRDVQPLIVMPQQPFQLTRPKVYVKVNEAAWSGWTGESGWPDAVPASVLFDPLSTVSATYGMAFQTQFRDNNNVWSSRPAIFVIDPDGVVRHVESDRDADEDIREGQIFPIVDDLQEQRRLLSALSANKDARGEAARIVLAPVGPQTKTAIPVMAEALKDEAAPVRAGAAAALYWIAAEAGAVVPALTRALEDGDSRVRQFSGMALGRIGPGARSAVPALIQLLVDEDTRVRAAATSALGRIGPEAAAALVQALQKDKAARIRAAAAAALPAIPDRPPAAVPALIAAIKDADAGVRAAAARALKKIDPQAAKKAGVK
jgi:HEAT repeats/AhpC/TSA family